jgi:hypothetical protein
MRDLQLLESLADGLDFLQDPHIALSICAAATGRLRLVVEDQDACFPVRHGADSCRAKALSMMLRIRSS